MNSLLQVLFRAAASGGITPPPPPPPPPPPGPGASFTGHTINLMVNGWYSDPWAFSNYIRFGRGQHDYPGDPNAISAYANANGWLANWPNNAECADPILATAGTPEGPLDVPPGDYVIRSNIPGVVCRIIPGFSQGLTNIVNGTDALPNCTFTITEADSVRADGCYFWIGYKNRSGGTIALMNHLYCGLVSNFAAHEAGEIFAPTYLAQIGSPACIRFNDWLGTNSGPNSNVAASLLPTEANRSWCSSSNGDDWGVKGTPLSVCAKLAKKVGAVVWFSVPVGNNYTRDIAATAADDRIQCSAHGYVANTPVAFYFYTAPGITRGVKYYVRDVLANSFKVSLTPGGAVVDIAADFNPGFKGWVTRLDLFPDPYPYYQAVADQIFTAWPEAKVVGEVGNESWNPTYNWDFLFGVGPFVTQKWSENGGVLFNGGSSIDFGLDGSRALAWYQTELWKAIETRATRAQNLRAITQQPGNPGPMLSAMSWVCTDYLAGSTFSSVLDGVFTAPYLIPQSSNPEEVAQGALTWTNEQWYQYYRRSIDFAVEEVKANVDGMAAAGFSALPIYCYESGIQARGVQETLSNGDFATLGTKRTSFMESAEAGKMGGEYTQRVFKAMGLKNNMIWQAANWVQTGGYAWGMNRSGWKARNAYNQFVIDEWAAPSVVPLAPVITLGEVSATTIEIDVGYAKFATSFRIEKLVGGSWVTASGAFTQSKTKFTVTGLTPATSVSLRARGINSIGDGAVSNVITQTTDVTQSVLYANNFAGDGALDAGWTFEGPTWARIDGQLRKTTTASGLAYRIVTGAKTLRFKQTKFGYHDMQVFFRRAGPNDYWAVRISDNIDRCTLYKVVGGVATDIAATGGGAVPGNRNPPDPRDFSIEWKDSTQSVTVKFQGAVLLTRSGLGSDLTNGGNGIGFYSNDQNSAFNFFDDVEVLG